MPGRRLLFALFVMLTAQAWLAEARAADAPAEYLVFGTVVWARAGDSSLALRGSSLLQHLRVRVTSYRMKQPSNLLDLRPGDAVTAVFSTKDGMLHRLRRVPISTRHRQGSMADTR
jgi:hypothetical protein